MPIPSNGGCSQTSVATRKKRKEERSQATIRQHYYPESGWGWVVVTVAFLVQVITHGFQMSYGVTLLAILKRWGPSRYMEAGRGNDSLILLGTSTSLWNTWLYTWQEEVYSPNPKIDLSHPKNLIFSFKPQICLGPYLKGKCMNLKTKPSIESHTIGN